MLLRNKNSCNSSKAVAVIFIAVTGSVHLSSYNADLHFRGRYGHNSMKLFEKSRRDAMFVASATRFQLSFVGAGCTCAAPTEPRGYSLLGAHKL